MLIQYLTYEFRADKGGLALLLPQPLELVGEGTLDAVGVSAAGELFAAAEAKAIDGARRHRLTAALKTRGLGKILLRTRAIDLF